MKVLIVENDFVSRKVMDKTLRNQDYEVVCVTEGQAAWEIIDSDAPPAIVVMNLVMPDMDGFELVERIQTRQMENYIFTLILTSKSDKEDIIHGIDSGADDYLTKPFYHGELLARIRAGERIVRLEHTLEKQNAALQQTNDALLHTNLRMKRDLEAAARIQQTLLPNAVPELPNINIEWLYKPCDELAGDTLNVFLLDESHLAFYLLDVSGHGVGAALLSVSLSRILAPLAINSSALLNKVAGSDQYEIVAPSRVATRLNKRFLMDDESQQYFTLIYGVLDLQTYECKFVSAGHPNLLLISDDEAPTTLKRTGLPIGFMEDEIYIDKTIQLKPGGRLYLFSDGINEATNQDAEQFGESRIIQSLQKHKRDALLTSIEKTTGYVESWSEAKVQDDISFLAIERT